VTGRQTSVASCVLACVALLLLVFIGASVSAAPTKAGILVSAPSPSPTKPPAPATSVCAPSGTGGVALSGACRGAVDTFSCISVTDDLYLSARRPMDGEHVLYLTINVESYRHHPGEYAGIQAFLQVTGPSVIPTWSNRGFTARVTSDLEVDLGQQVLAADPGTGADGTITLSGSARCAP
jgi:hypothetical protein